MSVFGCFGGFYLCSKCRNDVRSGKCHEDIQKGFPMKIKTSLLCFHLELLLCDSRGGTYELKHQCVVHWKSFVTQTVSTNTSFAAGHVPCIQSKQTLPHSIKSLMIVRWVGGCGLSFGNNRRSMWACDISMVTMWEVRRRRRRRSWKETMENLIWLAEIYSFSKAATHHIWRR